MSRRAFILAALAVVALAAAAARVRGLVDWAPPAAAQGPTEPGRT